MKRRVSLTLDPLVVRKGKQVARQNQQSLSSLVEELLAKSAGGKSAPEPEPLPVSERWRGKVKLAPKDDARFGRLAKKYLKP